MKEILVNLTNVTIRNNGAITFKGLNFTINKGEQWVLVGKSGSGKSTLLEALAGKKMISEGRVSHPYLDRVIKELLHNIGPAFSHYKPVALVSTTHGFKNLSNTTDFYYQQRFNSSDSEDAQTVGEYLVQEYIPAPASDWTVEKVTERLNLAHLANKQVIKLSNGETRRLMLAKALIKNPVLLLLDSPLTGLDVAARTDFNVLLAQIIASGINVVLTVNSNDLPNGITHIAVLDDCKIISKQDIALFRQQQPQIMPNKIIDTALLKTLITKQELPHYSTIIKMENVMIKYGDKTILEGINWEVKQGERWALSGHNGAGKSTLLSLVNGDNPQAYANNIVLFDKQRGSGESIWDIKKKIGFVSPELFQYFPAGSLCTEVIESGLYDTLGLFRAPSPKNKELILQWMTLLGIEYAENKQFKNAPGSVQRLCLLARALIKNPPLLIFDEPSQGMDTEQRNHFKYLVNYICKSSNVTLIYVSHYKEKIPECVTRFLKLDAGKIA